MFCHKAYNSRKEKTVLIEVIWKRHSLSSYIVHRKAIELAYYSICVELLQLLDGIE